MQKVGDITSTATPEGEFTDGNVAGGVNPTLLMALWFNTIQRELCNVVTESGGTLDPNDFTQVLEAIKRIAGSELDGKGFLVSSNNLSDLKNASTSRDNLGLKTAALKDITTSVTDTTNGRVPVVGWMGVGASAQDSAAGSSHVSRFMFEPFQPGTLYPVSVCVIQSGGPTATEWGQIAVSYGADFRVFAGQGTYNSPPEITEFYHDKRKPTASDVGAYPITGGTLNGNVSATGSVTSGTGKDISSGQDIWAGRDIYAQRNLNVTSVASVGSDLTVGGSVGVTGNVDAGGFVRSGAGKDVVSQNDIWASRYIYENGLRVYGPNNPPPNKFSKSLNTISWEKNLETGVIRQWGFVDVGDNNYVTVNLPIAFPSSFLSLTVTPRVPGAVSGSDVVSAFGQIQTNSTFGAGVSANFTPGWSGVYFEAIGV